MVAIEIRLITLAALMTTVMRIVQYLFLVVWMPWATAQRHVDTLQCEDAVADGPYGTEFVCLGDGVNGVCTRHKRALRWRSKRTVFTGRKHANAAYLCTRSTWRCLSFAT